ncbi:NAD-binding D-mandelate dehydrogenase [Yamadazyma tenuis]|uniref:Glyoxylate reductase n=1 Tax=Candida tenuis (strain ATCC 10573 / BCRC 21748 / CBS 615 / JCM 9827 / NBRC 10315 / NRRL Y-1498 / VKM Y-70) TaxID=590646 RepID=G3B0S8_CANTC|nr:uncharacterized protein CANTEDRAFT_113563 [Yamadazyma tenuis ATCC 10573]XP_006685939.1 uncharacterized protein CANTEDRAFT_113563 [Yamadazyma tenuis ATCC 10573]EGV65132.1 hypothetical protein CANTEDRAFT_113563 [Yamadazyma tenuis ATCC 10573]EGV65133.1 hypothetical protein CANTEDRAFT_113563 [Yamadazyma tenuis ATCC 10573]WEJ97587.1 NAD-binding D-mandelate dehydrogenase [Yamadazyma tenuis]
MSKPLILHTDPVRYGQAPWTEMEKIAEVVHIGQYSREQFIADLHGKYSNVVAIARGYLTGSKVGRFDEDLVSHFPPTLKYIAHQGAGYDQIDIEPLTKRGIQVSHCPDIVNASTADSNLFLLLGSMRNFEAGRRQLVAGNWPAGGFGAGVKEGINPTRKVLGIIAMGRIGRAFRDRCVPLGFEKIIYYNRSRLPAELEKDSVFVSSIEELVAQADVISINCPLNKATHHLISDELISKMKDGVIIVNTARGAIIDEQSLIKHLKSGKVGAAGLDVFENEPRPPKELLELPNVMALPHMGTHAVQTVFDMENWVIENVKSGLTTGKVISLVPEQQGVLDV